MECQLEIVSSASTENFIIVYIQFVSKSSLTYRHWLIQNFDTAAKEQHRSFWTPPRLGREKIYGLTDLSGCMGMFRGTYLPNKSFFKSFLYIHYLCTSSYWKHLKSHKTLTPVPCWKTKQFDYFNRRVLIVAWLWID